MTRNDVLNSWPHPNESIFFFFLISLMIYSKSNSEMQKLAGYGEFLLYLGAAGGNTQGIKLWQTRDRPFSNNWKWQSHRYCIRSVSHLIRISRVIKQAHPLNHRTQWTPLGGLTTLIMFLGFASDDLIACRCPQKGSIFFFSCWLSKKKQGRKRTMWVYCRKIKPLHSIFINTGTVSLILKGEGGKNSS